MRGTWSSPPTARRNTLILNERAKLLATLLNTAVAAVLTIGVVTPSVAAFWSIEPTRTPVEPW
jgi:hypothetical protein